MSETVVRPKDDGVQDRHGPETDRVVALPNAAAHERRRRYGGALLGGSALLLLAGGLGIGGWRHYQAAASTSRPPRKQSADLVPDVRVATVRASDGKITRQPAGDDDGVRGGKYFCAHQRLYREALCRYRRSGQGRRPAGGDHRARARPPDHAGQATLAQDQATLQQTQASRELAQVTNARDSNLVKQGWVTPQQGDNDRLTLQAQQAAVGVAQSNIAAQEAQIRILKQEKAYQRVVAPFDGVVTQRNIDNGSLVHVRIDLHVHADAHRRDPHPGVRAAGRGFRRCARRRGGRSRPGDSGPHLSRQGHADRERAAARNPDAADRDRRSQSGRRAQSRDLLHRRTVSSRARRRR